MTPFDFINSINFKKNNLMEDPSVEGMYVPFITNRTLSYFPDTISQAQEMNLCAHISNMPQYHYLLNNVRPSKRFAKWAKKEDDGDLDVVKQYYGYNNEKAVQALRVLSDQQLQQLRLRLERGGLDEKSGKPSGGVP